MLQFAVVYGIVNNIDSLFSFKKKTVLMNISFSISSIKNLKTNTDLGVPLNMLFNFLFYVKGM